MRNSWFRPTKANIEEMAEAFPLVKVAKVVDERPAEYQFTLSVKLVWWSWLMLGLGHLWVRRKLLRSRKLWTAAYVVAKVKIR